MIIFAFFPPPKDDLWGNAIFLKEANAISVELNKKVNKCGCHVYERMISNHAYVNAFRYRYCLLGHYGVVYICLKETIETNVYRRFCVFYSHEC